ncbi:MAG TPA: acyloxyacyl hydrolase [Acidobacteriaceae bacterium]|nr:acyloxyacyl hydrolase [Acidobacteriaceae bacterium]
MSHAIRVRQRCRNKLRLLVHRFRIPVRVLICAGMLIRISCTDLHAQMNTKLSSSMLRSNDAGNASLMNSFVSAPILTRSVSIRRRAPQRELIYEGMISYGNYRVFGAAEKVKLYTAGVEYDREFWHGFLGARVDYVSEILPVVRLSQPARTDFWGDPLTRNRKTVTGVGVTPIGFRLLWRDNRRLMPYFETKGTVLGFTQKALSPEATYENWSFHLTGGVKVRLHGRYDLRLGLLSDLHFSNAFVVRSNPAVDLMNVSVGLVRHLGSPGSAH